MKLLPIEEGCRAVIINSAAGNTGICVVVGQYLGIVGIFDGTNRWRVDKSMSTTYGDSCYHVDESQLMRIDGNEDLFKSEEDNKTLELVK